MGIQEKQATGKSISLESSPASPSGNEADLLERSSTEVGIEIDFRWLRMFLLKI